jgi:hypothetical protein
MHDYRVIRPVSDDVFSKLFTTGLMGHRTAAWKISESTIRLVRLR